MRVVDTSAWIEFLAASPAGTALTDEIPGRDTWLVPTIVQLELAKWLTREAGEDKADQVTAFTEMCVVVPLDTKTALKAAMLCVRHRLAAADAVVYATALVHNADLLSCDAHFDGLPGVMFIPKSGHRPPSS
jgi:predicted nucleic acid-binding protein